MKKFTRILICLMLCVFSFSFVACDRRTEEEKNFTYPSAGDEIVGNGGLAVRKGNYLYFVNGYKSINNAVKDGKYNVGSLLLMKLDDNGNIVTDENGLLKDDYYITMSNALCGYEATNLFIFGDYLYFVSPCEENESKETAGSNDVWAKERVIFNRIKLDKTSKVETVYESGVKLDKLEYQYYCDSANLFILVWEKDGSYYAENGNNALIRVHANGKSSSIISNDVTDVVFAKSFYEIFYQVDKTVYQYNISGAQGSEYITNFNYDLQFVANGNVYATEAISVGAVSGTKVRVSNIALKSGFDDVYTYSDSLTLSVTPDDLCLVASGTNQIILIPTDDYQPITINVKDATKIEVVGFVNGCVVYVADTTTNSLIQTISYSNAVGGDVQVPKTLATLSVISEDIRYFDMAEDENYLYFISTQGSNNYLFRVKVKNNMGEEHEVVGVYENGDAPVVEEEPSEEEEE